MDNNALDQLIDFYQKKSKIVNSVLGAVGLLAVAIGGYFYLYKIPQEEESAEALYHIQYLFALEDTTSVHYEKILQGEIGQFRGAKYIAENFPSTKAGNLAKYYVGYCLYRLHRDDEAISFLENCTIEDELVQTRAYALFADILADKTQYQKAATLYQKAANELGYNLLYSPIYYYRSGLLYELAGQPAKAVKVYEKALAVFPFEINNNKSVPGIFDKIRKQLEMLKGE